MAIKTKNKEAILLYRQRWTETVFDSTFVPDESKADQQKRIVRAKRDYAFFVDYYFPHYATAKCADFQIKAANKIKRDPQCKEVMKWARGHAKSTHLNILIPMWLKIQDKNSFRVMVLVGKNQDNAITLISDLQTELEYNQRYINDYGAQIKLGSWEDGRFVTKDDRAFFALGRGQSPRGLRYKQYRPDLIVPDDLDDDELSRNPDRVEKTYKWLIEALFGTMDMGRGRFIMVGNLISKCSVLQKLSENPRFNTTQVDALDKNGNPSWAKYTLDEIKDMIEIMGYRSAQKELFNNPITDGSVFKQEWIEYIKPLPLKQYERIIAYCDPSFKNTRTSDYKAVIVVGLTKDGKIHILKSFVRKCSVGELVRWFYNYHETLPSDIICEYYMEANFIQDLLMDEFEAEGSNRGFQLPLRKDMRKKPDKFARIEAISPLFERGQILLSEREKNNPDMMVFIEQLLAIEKGSRSNDDAPDALEGGVHLLSGTMRKKTLPFIMKSRESRHY